MFYVARADNRSMRLSSIALIVFALVVVAIASGGPASPTPNAQAASSTKLSFHNARRAVNARARRVCRQTPGCDRFIAPPNSNCRRRNSKTITCVLAYLYDKTFDYAACQPQYKASNRSGKVKVTAYDPYRTVWCTT